MAHRWIDRATIAALFLLELSTSSFAAPTLRHRVDSLSSTLGWKPRRRQESTVAITGIQAFGIQPRIEIRQMEQDVDMWNIYLLGLRRFQLTDQSEMTSYYQIAGIHGRPYVPWDNVAPFSGNEEGPGYCTHVLNIFLPWHRAYMALYEQILYQHIVDAVNDFPAGAQRQRYAAAALSWRHPYWDWAAPPPAGQSVYPTSLQTPTVNVTMSNGTTAIPNPLYSYQFHPVNATDFYFNPFASWNQTMRFPTSWSQNATSQDALLGPVFDNNQVSFQDRLYNLFVNYNNFTEFADEAWMTPSVENADSLESIHDAIHSIIGSNGHMTYLDYSAYDPSFWLHHAMIDRCFALWQALYPDSYVEPMAAVEQTFTIKLGDVKDENSALEPFFSNTERDYWTASSLRSTQTFGYTYPELAGNASISAVKAAINRLYGSSAGNRGLSKRDSSPHEREVPDAIADAQPTTAITDPDGKHHQYLANIVSQKFALNGSYAIYLFMGDFNEDPAAWATEPNLVGTHAVFTALPGVDVSTGHKVKRSSGSAIQVTGSMPLTSMLVAKVQAAELRDLETGTVEDYLFENLNWRVAMFDGSEVPVQHVADLKVTVVTAQVQPATSADQFPLWSNFTELRRITQGKPGCC